MLVTTELTIKREDLLSLLSELSAQASQIRRLQARCQKYQDEQRGLRYQVSCFAEKFGMHRAFSPSIPDDNEVRLRLRLIVEEFFEVLEAVLPAWGVRPWLLVKIKKDLDTWVGEAPIDVNFPEFVDGLADLDYVVEGARISFGVDGRPVANEVHRSNMEKEGGPLRDDGKILKPEGWKPPDIVGELVKQGWSPFGDPKEGTVQ